MKCQISKHCSGYEVYGYAGKSIGHIHKDRVGRKKLWVLISDDLAWWRPDCLREVADFIDTLESVESPKPAHNSQSEPEA